jgi:hypothetical protein
LSYNLIAYIKNVRGYSKIVIKIQKKYLGSIKLPISSEHTLLIDGVLVEGSHVSVKNRVLRPKIKKKSRESISPRGCLYNGHWRFIWSLISGSVKLVEVRASWLGHPH